MRISFAKKWNSPQTLVLAAVALLPIPLAYEAVTMVAV